MPPSNDPYKTSQAPDATYPEHATRNNSKGTDVDKDALERFKIREICEGWPVYRDAAEWRNYRSMACGALESRRGHDAQHAYSSTTMRTLRRPGSREPSTSSSRRLSRSVDVLQHDPGAQTSARALRPARASCTSCTVSPARLSTSRATGRSVALASTRSRATPADVAHRYPR
jgi:hypothetical protein